MRSPFRNYRLALVGTTPASANLLIAGDQFVERARMYARTNNLLAYRRAMDVPGEGRLRVVIDGTLTTLFVEPYAPLPDELEGTTPIPDFISGAVYDPDVRPAVDAAAAYVTQYKPTFDTGRRVALASPDRQNTERLVVDAGSKVYAGRVPASAYSGLMAKLVQLIYGYGDTPLGGEEGPSAYSAPEQLALTPLEEGVFGGDGVLNPYGYAFPDNHGVVKASDGSPFVVHLSSDGVVAMPLRRIYATTLPGFRRMLQRRTDDEAVKILDTFGGFPVPEDIPTEPTLRAAMFRAGKIVRLLAPHDMPQHKGHQPLSNAIGWTFNMSGTEAQHVLWYPYDVFDSTGKKQTWRYTARWRIQFAIDPVQARPVVAPSRALVLARIANTTYITPEYTTVLREKIDWLPENVLRGMISMSPESLWAAVDAQQVTRFTGTAEIGIEEEGRLCKTGGDFSLLVPVYNATTFYPAVRAATLNSSVIEYQQSGFTIEVGYPPTADGPLHAYFHGDELHVMSCIAEEAVARGEDTAVVASDLAMTQTYTGTSGPYIYRAVVVSNSSAGYHEAIDGRTGLINPTAPSAVAAGWVHEWHYGLKRLSTSTGQLDLSSSEVGYSGLAAFIPPTPRFSNMYSYTYRREERLDPWRWATVSYIASPLTADFNQAHAIVHGGAPVSEMLDANTRRDRKLVIWAATGTRQLRTIKETYQLPSYDATLVLIPGARDGAAWRISAGNFNYSFSDKTEDLAAGYAGQVQVYGVVEDWQLIPSVRLSRTVTGPTAVSLSFRSDPPTATFTRGGVWFYTDSSLVLNPIDMVYDIAPYDYILGADPFSIPGYYTVPTGGIYTVKWTSNPGAPLRTAIGYYSSSLSGTLTGAVSPLGLGPHPSSAPPGWDGPIGNAAEPPTGGGTQSARPTTITSSTLVGGVASVWRVHLPGMSQPREFLRVEDPSPTVEQPTQLPVATEYLSLDRVAVPGETFTCFLCRGAYTLYGTQDTAASPDSGWAFDFAGTSSPSDGGATGAPHAYRALRRGEWSGLTDEFPIYVGVV